MLYFVIGFFAIILVGMALHFVFDLTHHCPASKIVAAVNESTYEHIKIGLAPTFLWAIVGLFIPNLNNFAFGVFIALATIFIAIPTLFYAYSLPLKRSILLVDISIFIVSIALGILFAFFIFTAQPFNPIFNIIGIIGICIIAIIYITLVFVTPKCFLFKDPITGGYGIDGHPEFMDHKHNHTEHSHADNNSKTGSKPAPRKSKKQTTVYSIDKTDKK